MKDILRYLGVRESDAATEEMIEEMRCLADGIIPSVVYACYSADRTNEGLRLQGTDILLTGNLVKRHFEGCDRILIVLATLGLKSELLLKRIFATNAAKAVVLDAVYTDKIEKFLDKTELELQRQFGSLTERISCGYGDLPIATQKQLFDELDGGRIGVSINDCYMLTPNKSVIALLGGR